MSATSVEFIYDYASPWSYLATELLDRRLPGVPITFRPVYLRGFEAFSKGMPYGANRARYIVSDLRRCATHWDVRVKFPSVFPVNGIYGVRGALWVQAHDPTRFAAYHRAMFAAAWRDDRDIGKRDVAVEVAVSVGIDGATFAAGIEDPALKERLKTHTAAQQTRGVFGVPTFFVVGATGEDLYFGHDRMDYIARALGVKGE